jgi:hypothetical protein
MTNETTLQTVTATLPVPAGFRAEWREPLAGEKFYIQGDWVKATYDWNAGHKSFVLVPLFTPPQWLVESDYTSVKWRSERWCLWIEENEWTACDVHHDLRDMLAGIDPKITPVAWERGK